MVGGVKNLSFLASLKIRRALTYPVSAISGFTQLSFFICIGSARISKVEQPLISACRFGNSVKRHEGGLEKKMGQNNQKLTIEHANESHVVIVLLLIDMLMLILMCLVIPVTQSCIRLCWSTIILGPRHHHFRNQQAIQHCIYNYINDRILFHEDLSQRQLFELV